MAIFIRKKQEVHAFTGIGKLSIISLFIGISIALVGTIWAVYVDSFVNNISLVGFITGAFAVISFFSHFAIIPLIEKSKKSSLLSKVLFLFAFFYLFFYFVKDFYVFLLIGALMIILQTIRVTCFGIIVKDKSRKNKLTRNEGIIYTFFNIAFVIGPLLAGFVANRFSVNAVFIVASFFAFTAFILFKAFKIIDCHVSKKINHDMKKNFFDFFKDKSRRISYVISGGVNLWWSLIYIYIPLFIIRSQLSELWVGYFLFGVAVPLIFLEYRFANKVSKIGFIKTFMTGYLIVAVLALTCFFVSNIFIILALLVLASVGMAMIEPTSEAYFFNILKKDEANRFYSPYNTAIDVNYLFGKILPAILLIFLPFKFVFLLFAFLMFLIFLVSSKAKNVIEGKSVQLKK